ncbi:MAG: recombinase family protein [Candidatus Pacebacteria bacterium]|nr:recombinase family protein [Candidatus Paceibacterota bacterium]
MKAVNVARVSTDEQKENSPEAQLFRVKEYCDRKKIDVIKEFSFSESAYKTKRDEFDKLLEYVQEVAKKEKIAVCFDKVDRLSRSVFDKRVGTLYEMAVADQIELHFVSDNQIINNQMSAVEKFQFGMSLGLAKYYSDAIGDNVKRAFEKKRRNGEWTGAVRLGYLNVPLDEGKRLRKDIIIDPERGHLIQKLFELYSTGNYSYTTLRDAIIKEGLTTLKGRAPSRSIIENILKDLFYCGTAVSKKYGSYTHKYPRLISRELFDRCQEIRLKRQKTPTKASSKIDYILGDGLLKCKNCGCAISFETKNKPSGKVYIIGSCTNAKGICKREYVNEKILLEPIYKILDKFGTITEDVQNDLVDELRKNTEAEVEYHQQQISRLRSEYDKIKKMDDNLIDMLASESITKDIYDKKHQEYADKLQTLEAELSVHREADYEYQTTVSTVISVARRARSIFENCSEPMQKRAFLKFLLQNPVVDGKNLEFSMASPFNLVLELADSPSLLPRQDSNLRPIDYIYP